MMKLIKLSILILSITVISSCVSDSPNSVSTDITQEISLDDGWNMWSTYINTTDSLLVIMSDIKENILAIKDDSIYVYFPSQGINSIGTHEVGKSYQIRVDQDKTFSITGSKVHSGDHPIILEEGWNYLGYLLDVEADPLIVLESIFPYIVIIKDDAGLSLWPDLGLNMLGNMKPGEGYIIRMNASCVLYYPNEITN